MLLSNIYYDHYEFLVIFFYAINAPIVFIYLMKYVFKVYIDSFIIIFIEDILVYSKYWKNINYMLLFWSFCFGLRAITFLGHMMSGSRTFVEKV